MLLSAFQIDKLINGFVRVNNFSASGGSSTVTTPITSALSTAGDGGVAVPLQVATSAQVGVVPTVVPLFANTSKKPILDSNNNEVYGKLTEASGVYTLTYYSNVAGTETAYTFAASTAIDFLISYRFDFGRLPTDIATAFPVGDVNVPGGAAASAQKWFTEKLSVTATNTVANLTKTPDVATNVFLIVNGKHENAFGGASAAFSTSGKVITWSATNAKYALQTTHDVIAFYTTLE